MSEKVPCDECGRLVAAEDGTCAPCAKAWYEETYGNGQSVEQEIGTKRAESLIADGKVLIAIGEALLELDAEAQIRVIRATCELKGLRLS